jgi:hypothetical protein
MEGRDYEKGAPPPEDSYKDDPRLRARTSIHFGRFQSEVRVRDKDVITPAQAVRRPVGVLLSKELWSAAQKNVRMVYFLLRDDDDTLLWISKRSKNNVVTYREPAEPGAYTLYIYKYTEGRRFHSPKTRRSFDLKRYVSDHSLHLMDRIRFRVSASAAYGQTRLQQPVDEEAAGLLVRHRSRSRSRSPRTSPSPSRKRRPTDSPSRTYDMSREADVSRRTRRDRLPDDRTPWLDDNDWTREVPPPLPPPPEDAPRVEDETDRYSRRQVMAYPSSERPTPPPPLDEEDESRRLLALALSMSK